MGEIQVSGLLELMAAFFFIVALFYFSLLLCNHKITSDHQVIS